jgi:hypothetical protein
MRKIYVHNMSPEEFFKLKIEKNFNYGSGTPGR